MALPLLLAGPILRHVETNLVAGRVALGEVCRAKLSLWENQIFGVTWSRSGQGGER